MLHHVTTRWDNNHGSIDVPVPIDPDSAHGGPIYYYGGQVHRIIVGGDNQRDYMVCDTSVCLMCNEDANNGQPSKAGGLPFVHSIDTTCDGQITVFTPKPKPSNGKMVDGLIRRARFQTQEGVISCVVRICGYVGCEVCKTFTM
jgi:hypothetical protein